MISEMSYELGILAKAIHHKNLSAASSHIGISQPQLSRIIARVEDRLNVVLLDRSAKRKSSWTPLAYELVTRYSKSMTRLESEILALAEERDITELHIGTLEGLMVIARDFVQKSFADIGVKKIYLDVLEFEDLDSQFLEEKLDLIFTVRPPSKQKYSRIIEVGFQQNERISTSSNTLVLSPNEYLKHDVKQIESTKNVLISNSLALRDFWLHEIGGTGSLPTSAQRGKGKGFYSVYLFGSALLSTKMWKNIELIYE